MNRFNEYLMLLILTVFIAIFTYYYPNYLFQNLIIFLCIIFLILMYGISALRPISYLWLRLTLPITIFLSRFFSRILYLVIFSFGYILRLVGYLDFNSAKSRKLYIQRDFNNDFFDKEY